MTEIHFTLDGHTVTGRAGETIWQVAERHGVEIPHLCWLPSPGYRADGNCRACVVEVHGERALAASCTRKPTAGMSVETASPRVKAARKMVFELLLADQPPKEVAHDPDSRFWRWAEAVGVTASRFPARPRPKPDRSHPAIAVNLDACIRCTLCVRACREVQGNDVIGMAHRASHAKPSFDCDDPLCRSTCVACGECVQACPTGALMPAAQVDARGLKTVTPDRTVDSVCPYCGVGCQLTFQIQDDRLVGAIGRDGPANQNRLCVKGRFGFDYVHHPHRLTRPLIRRADAPKGADMAVDPTTPWTHFREATWEEALDRTATDLRRIRDGHGGNALAGFGSAKGSNEEAYLFQKLVRTGFGTNNVDHCTRLCHASSVAALMEGIGSGAVTAPIEECRNAEVIFVIGANPAVNHPVAASFIKNAVRKGATLIVADPRGQALARFATHVLRFRPGTDVALLNGMLATIVEEGLTDQAFIKTHTEGFAALADHVKGFSAEAMAPLCGVDATEIRTIARRFATARTAMVFWGMGVSQHVHGTDNVRCLISLALMTGKVGRPGCGLHPLRGQNNVQGASDAGLIPMVYPDYRPVEDPEVRARYEAFWGAPLDPKKGLTVVEIMDAIHAGQIRGMYIMGENPAMSDPDAGHARAALAKLDMLVVQDIFLTETAFHADVVLPASAFPEKTGSFTNTDRRVQLARKALPCPGEAREDWRIIQELARRFGLPWSYPHVSEVYEEMRKVMPPLAGIPWTRLEAQGSVVAPCEDETQPGRAILGGNGFATANGRGRFVPAAITPPDETPDDEYPMILTTGRILEHWHTGSMTRRAAALDAIEPEAMALLAPADLTRLGVAPGGVVEVATRRGRIRIKARADRDVAPGMLFIPFCYAEAAANLLTNPALDPVGKIPEFKFCAARVERPA
ncbi:formate dehydrogenase subunit alpha [Azospirillum sp. sgz301742]